MITQVITQAIAQTITQTIKRSVVVFTGLMLLSANAFADQFAYVDHSTAQKAVEELRSSTGKEYIEYCEPCSEGSKSGSAEVLAFNFDQINAVKIDENYTQVLIDDKQVDLAYTYINKSGRWVNLALLLGLDAKNVSDELISEDTISETATVSSELSVNDVLIENTLTKK